MRNNPLVSAILPVYEPDEEWLEIAVRSVLNQSYDNLELVIVNDGSEKQLDEIINPKIIEKENVRGYYQENQGFTGATNTAISKAKGKYVAPIGQDDMWNKKKIEKQITDMQTSDVASFSKAKIIDKNGSRVSSMGKIQTDNIERKLLEGNFICYEGSLIKKSEMPDSYLNTDYQVSSDYDLWLNLLPGEDFSYIDEYLVKKRRHEEAGSFDPSQYFDEDRNIIKNYCKDSEIDFKDVWSPYLRRKGKGLYKIGKKKEARTFWKKSFFTQKNIFSLALLALSFNKTLYNSINELYRKHAN
ncbi:MAG: glycosyltransferase family 2 protein [Candidatus Nanohalobium sp.]